MQTKSDAQLLCEYAAQSYDPAFGEIVARHTDLVYCAAWRQTGSPELAREIVQSVFTDLAGKARALAGTLKADASLAGWLYRATRFATLTRLRGEHRRQAHERQFMEHFNPASPAATESATDWERIAPVLDEAMAELGDADREAVLLRYFKNQDFQAVGVALGVSDDTAQKRVSRAVERLREFFAKRGVTVGASGLVVIVSANAVQAAPAGLAATLTTASLASAAVGTGTTLTLLKFMAMTKLKLTVAGALLAIVLTPVILWQMNEYRLRNVVAVTPQNKYARAHFERWQKYTRENGDIPGGLIAMLDASLADKGDPKLQELRKRLDGTRDWPANDGADLLAAIAATDNWLDDDGRLSELENYDIAQTGKPLPPELAALPWGTPDEGLNDATESTGLRAAFTLDPAAASYAQGEQLPVTVHYHNSSTAPLVFPLGPRYMDLAETHDEQGRKVFTQWTLGALHSGRVQDPPIGTRHSVRLEPGHWISVTGALLTLAPGHFADTPDSHGIVMLARAGSTVRLRWVATTATWREGRGKAIEWKDRVAKCIERVSPMPKSRADREHLIRRVTLSLTGKEAAKADVAAFAAEDSPDALTKLTARFQSLPPLARFSGWLKTGEQTFKVTPGPVDYRGTVMTARGSGLYELTDSVYLHHGGAHANFEFTPPAPVPHPRTIHLNDKENRMAPHGIVWRHGSGVVWVAEKARVRKFDFTVPGKLTETELPAGIASIPEELRAELVKAFPASREGGGSGERQPAL